MASSTPSTLPTDMVLEIIARSDTSTLVRCAATCKLLRRDILDPFFLHRVTQQGGIVPSCFLAYLKKPKCYFPPHDQPPISLVHPDTLAAASFCDNHLAPIVSREAKANKLLRQYDPLTSRGGLVVLLCFCVFRDDPHSDLCVYNPMTGERTFLVDPPSIFTNYMYTGNQSFVMLTAADGISCSSFLLLAADVSCYHGHPIMVRTVMLDGTGWGPFVEPVSVGIPLRPLLDDSDAVVLRGGVIHWLLQDYKGILKYDVLNTKASMVKLPSVTPRYISQGHLGLGKSLDGRLRLLAADKFMISMWLQLSSVDGCWETEAVINVEEKLQLLDPNIQATISRGYESIKFMYCRERSGVVLLRVKSLLVILDVKTKKMCCQDNLDNSSLLEIDLLSRLQAMKIFS